MSPLAQPLPTAPWGVLVGVYFMLIGVASGTTLVAEWVRPQDERTAVPFVWKMGWIALLTLVVCGVILIVDLGRPARFFLMLTSVANPGSVMSIGAKLIALKGFLVVLYLGLLYRRRRALAMGDVALAPGATQALYTLVQTLLAIASVCLAAYPAVLLSRTWGSPLAASPGSALLFVTTALLMGAAVATLVARDVDTLGRLRGAMRFLAGAQLGLLLLAGLALYGGAPKLEQALDTLVAGRAAVPFWSLAVGLGLGVPSVALATGRYPRLLTTVSALCLLVGAATLRFLAFTVA